jgi:hypothetical protein
MARFSQVGGARARWPSSPPDYGDPSQPILFPEGWAFEVRSIKPRTGGFLGKHMGTVGGWHHSVAVAVSVSQRQAGLSISSQLTGKMALLLPVRPAGKQLRQFSSPTCGPSEVGAAMFFVTPLHQRQDEPRCTFTTESVTCCIDRALAAITLLGEDPLNST